MERSFRLPEGRRDDSGRAPFRSGRFFCVNGQWFFSTREGVDIGPYPSRVVAGTALQNLLRNHSFAAKRRRTLACFAHDHEASADWPHQGHRFYW